MDEENVTKVTVVVREWSPRNQYERAAHHYTANIDEVVHGSQTLDIYFTDGSSIHHPWHTIIQVGTETS